MIRPTIFAMVCAMPAAAQDRTAQVFLEDAGGDRIEIATLNLAPADDATRYAVSMNGDAFAEHFLSMRPFKCVEGPEKLWCHVPYPYAIAREVTASDATDLEYDFLFVWKGAGEYGIDMWNGVYYRLTPDAEGWVGEMYEFDMGQLAVPPSAGDMRPIATGDLHPADSDSHWLPRLVIE